MRYNNYACYSDEELITMFRDGEQEIASYLVEKYKELVRIKAKSMFILGGDNDDLIQEGMIGLFKAVHFYDSGRDASFKTFAELCVVRQMYTAIEASNRMKNMPLNSYVSIYVNSDNQDEEGAVFVEALQSITDRSPEELLIDRENCLNFENALFASLSDFEKSVLRLRLTGAGYAEIARILGKDDKSTDNALTRIKTKARKILDELNDK